MTMKKFYPNYKLILFYFALFSALLSSTSLVYATAPSEEKSQEIPLAPRAKSTRKSSKRGQEGRFPERVLFERNLFYYPQSNVSPRPEGTRKSPKKRKKS